jgi:hypothetical protein
MSARADAHSGGALLHSLHGILHLEEAALRGPSRHVAVVEIAELAAANVRAQTEPGTSYHSAIAARVQCHGSN